VKKQFIGYIVAALLIAIVMLSGTAGSLLQIPFGTVGKSALLASVTDPLVPPSTVRDNLKKGGIYFGTYFNEPDMWLYYPRPKNYLSQIQPYFSAYTIPAFLNHTEGKGQGVFDFSGPDLVADFAVGNGAKIRVHNLVWYLNIPSWLSSGSFTPDQMSAILKENVQTVVKHYMEKYPGSVLAIDVVNEPICDDGQAGCTDGLRNMPWSVIHKPGSTDPSDYIALAFQWARDVAPDAKLYINEYGIEYASPKADRLYALVKKLNDQDVPIDGIGFQSHVFVNWNHSSDELVSVMNRFAALGLTSEVTENDVFIPPQKDSIVSTPATSDELQRQANVYSQFLNACIQAQKCDAYVVFGAWDPVSWGNNSADPSFTPYTIKAKLTAGIATVSFAVTSGNLYTQAVSITPVGDAQVIPSFSLETSLAKLGNPITINYVPGGWGYHVNDIISQVITVPADGTYNIGVLARGIGATSMDVSVNGTVIQSIDVKNDSTSYVPLYHPDILDNNFGQKPAFQALVNASSAVVPLPATVTAPSTPDIVSSPVATGAVSNNVVVSDQASSQDPLIPTTSIPVDIPVSAPTLVSIPQAVTTSISKAISNLVPTLPTGTWSFIPILKNIVSPSSPTTSTVTPAVPVQVAIKDGGSKKSYTIAQADYALNGSLIHSTTTYPDGWMLDTASLADGSYTLDTKFYYADGTTDRASSTFTVDNSPTVLEKIVTYVRSLLKKQ
jgi:endo-1,4-beta-xylanase